MRWLAILAVAFVLIAGSRAEAQVFKPRGGKAAAGKPAKKPAAEKPAKKKAPEKVAKADAGDDDEAEPTKKARVAKTTPKKKSRAVEGRPTKGKKGRASKIDDDDEGNEAAGDDEVIITDDDD